jgi:TRAP-type C4-dicarboxylate transport system permease small subunit
MMERSMWLKKMASGISKAVESTSFGFACIGLVGLVVMAGLTFMDVFLRYVFNRPILGSTEIIEYTMVCLITGAALCALRGRHVKMELFVQRLPQKAQVVIDTTTLLVSLVVYGLASWRIILEALHARATGLESDFLAIPAYPFYWVLGISMLLMSLAMITIIGQNIVKAVRK